MEIEDSDVEDQEWEDVEEDNALNCFKKLKLVLSDNSFHNFHEINCQVKTNCGFS